MIETPPHPSVISTEAGQPPIGKPLIVQARGQLRLTWRLYAESPQSGEISPSHGMQQAGDLSAQRLNSPEVFIPIPPCPSARDDGGGRQHTVISKGQMAEAPHRTFVISTVAAKWRNLTLPGYAAGRRSLDSASQRPQSLYLLYRHVPPLEMTMAAGGIQ